MVNYKIILEETEDGLEITFEDYKTNSTMHLHESEWEGDGLFLLGAKVMMDTCKKSHRKVMETDINELRKGLEI